MGGLGGDERLCSTREVKAKEPSSQVEPEAKVEKKAKTGESESRFSGVKATGLGCVKSSAHWL